MRVIIRQLPYLLTSSKTYTLPLDFAKLELVRGLKDLKDRGFLQRVSILIMAISLEENLLLL